VNESVDLPLGQLLAEKNYLRGRQRPSLKDPSYLILADLYEAIKRTAPPIRGRVFDYGCGGAPYRHLFEGCDEYVCADITPGPRVQRLLQPDGRTQEGDDQYHAVFSAQVLEHVPSPENYLRECHRILKPDGELILSTHGMTEEHGCPNDFHRWTSHGLEQLVTREGFRVVESLKLTTEIRAVFQLLHQSMDHLRCREQLFLHYIFALVRKLYFFLSLPALNWLGGYFQNQGVVPSSHPTSLYVGIFLRARKV